MEGSALERGDYYVEYRVLLADGSVHWLGNSGKFIFDSSGNRKSRLARVSTSPAPRARAERERIFERERAAREQASAAAASRRIHRHRSTNCAHR